MLKLQKIELLGFKSFADHTAISFNDGGIAAIVGPNGCGKSNISDAISWVLGEQSPKNLRSGRMQDVIFNGTPGRKATGLAEVHLTLTDPEREMPLPSHIVHTATANRHSAQNDLENKPAKDAWKGSGEIVVSRRLFHSGESEYLLNGHACRLRDVQELFLGTGLGPDAYAVIEQGRVGQILSSKPYELRGLIEEAAGVTKFKAKRKLAWAKLESSKQNLSRVNDILEEITRQLNSLKRQAARAHRYTELRDEMRSQLRVVLVGNYSDKEQDAVRIALELGMMNRSLQERIALTESRETEQREVHRHYEEEEAGLRRTAEERSVLRLSAEQARNQASSQAQQIRYLETRMDEALGEENRVSGRLENLQSERKSCASFLTEIQAEMELLAGQSIESQNRFQSCQNNLKDKERTLGQLRDEMLETVGQCATLRNQVLQQEQFLNSTERQIERSESERAATAGAHAAATGRRGEIHDGMVRQREELEAIASKRASLEESLRADKEDEVRQRATLEQLRSELAAQRARRASLEEILTRRAYSTETVKRLFEAHAAPKDVSDTSSQSQPHSEEISRSTFEPAGVLADFIEVEPAYERMVEEFLREELDYVVVENWDAAKEGVRLLRSVVPGRATFLLATFPPKDAAASHSAGIANEAMPAGMFDSTPGVLGTLDSHVRFTAALKNSVGPLLPRLRRCVLVSDAEIGQTLASSHPDYSFMTPEGDWFQGDCVTAGRADNTGPLALKRELRELTRSLADREESAARAALELTQLGESIAQQQSDLQALVEEQQSAEKRMVMAERDGKEASAECERLNARLELIALEAERLRRESGHARRQLDENTREIEHREQRKLEIETETAAISGAMAELETAREEAHREAMESRSRHAALEERHRASANALTRMERDMQEHTEQLASLHRQRELWSRQKSGFEESNQRLEREAVAAELRFEELTLKLAEMEKSYELRRQRLAEIEQELQSHRRELEDARNKKSAAEVQLARLEAELSHLKESCRNELGVEMEALAAEQASIVNPEDLAAAELSYRQLKVKIDGLGPINMMALEEYEECRQRHDFLEIQKQDLMDSIRDTTQAIEEIDEVSQKQFADAFEQINGHFQRMFELLFAGGQGFLRLTEAENAADRGVEIVAQPPGKKLQNVLLLSGGEKAMTALALLLATFRYKPSPFCVLDEVDAPLDEANIGRFTRMVQEMSRDTQFIIITHSKRTMSIAPVLYGVTMEEPGVSKIVSVKFNSAAPVPAASRVLAEVAV